MRKRSPKFGNVFLLGFSLMAVLVGFFSPLQSHALTTGTFMAGVPGRPTGGADTTSTDVFRFYCDPTLRLTKLWFYGSFSGSSGSAYFEAGTATGTVAVGSGGTGNVARQASSFTPQNCTPGYVDIKFYRSGTAVTLFRANSLANGWFEGYDSSNPPYNIAVCQSCTNFSAGNIMNIIGEFQYSIALATSTSGGSSSSSSDMSTTTIALAYGPIHYSLGILVFLFAVITWFIVIRRNRR